MNKIIQTLIILILFSGIASASNNVYSVSENQISKPGIFKIMASENITSDVLIGSERIYFYTSNFVYFANSTTGEIISKIKILNSLQQKLDNDTLFVRTKNIIYSLNSTSGIIISKIQYNEETGKIYVPSPLSSISQQVTNFSDLNTKVNKSGDTMSGNLNMNGNNIIGFNYFQPKQGTYPGFLSQPGVNNGHVVLGFDNHYIVFDRLENLTSDNYACLKSGFSENFPTGLTLTYSSEPCTPSGKGEKGDPGINGSNGINGTNGINGSNGINGTNGINGSNGINGTSFNYSDTRYYVGGFTKNMGDAAGTQVISGLPFEAKYVQFETDVAGTITESAGYDSITSRFVKARAWNSNWAYGALASIYNTPASGKEYYGSISSANSTSFTITWSKTSTPTGTIEIMYTAFR